MKVILFVLFTFILFGCDTQFAIPDKRFKAGNATQYTIFQGENYSNNRGPNIHNGRTLIFDVMFETNIIYTPKDSAYHKVYGLSDNFAHHLDNSARLAFKVYNPIDSLIYLYAYWYFDGILCAKIVNGKLVKGQPILISVVKPSEYNRIKIKIERDRYMFWVNDELKHIAEGRTKKGLWGIHYRNFFYFEDGEKEGAPHRMDLFIDERE